MPDENRESTPPGSGALEGNQGQDLGTRGPQLETVGHEMPTVGRQTFRGLRRELTEEELANPGVRIMLLGEVERMDSECSNLKGYMERFHEADKKGAVLEEKLKTSSVLDIYFGVGIGLGGVILGLLPYFWEKIPSYSYIPLAIGVILIIGAIVAKLIKP